MLIFISIEMMRLPLRFLGLVALASTFIAFAGSGAAHAAEPPPLQPITNRNYALDLYEGVVFGSPRLVAMGGATFAVGEGASGLFTNPASAALRPSTPSDTLEISGFFNSYVPAEGIDFNNNGDATTRYRRAAVYAPGLLVQYGRWGFALNVGYVRYEVSPQAGGGLGARSITPHLAVARRVLNNSVVLGAGIRGGALNVYNREGSEGLFTRLGASGEFGAVWQPQKANVRLALAGGLPVYTGAVDTNCDPMNCQGYILPNQAIVPWVLVLGSAYRFAHQAWNQQVSTDHRDERHFTVALDLLIAGSLSNAYGLEQFAAKQLQPSGREVSYSPRLGLEYELIPGWWRLRAGSYWEPSRFIGVSGRIHGTGGTEVRLFAFRLGGHERRISLAVAGDVAERYHNLGLSVGFWN